MPISMNSPSASIAATPADVDCSSSASCSTRSLPHPLDIGLHALALKHKTTTCSGHCTQAATPLFGLSRRFPIENLTHRLTVGRAPVPHRHFTILRGRTDVGMPHELLLNFQRGVRLAQQRAVSVPEGMPADAAQADCSSCGPTRIVNSDEWALAPAGGKAAATDSRLCSAFRARHEAKTSPSDPVLLNWRSVIAPPCDVTGEDQTDALAFELPVEHHSSKAWVEWQLVLRVLALRSEEHTSE